MYSEDASTFRRICQFHYKTPFPRTGYLVKFSQYAVFLKAHGSSIARHRFTLRNFWLYVELVVILS